MPVSPEPFDAYSLFRDIHDTFEALVVKIDQALECLPADEEDGEEWRKLHSAKKAAERGAELARSQLRSKR